MKRRHYRTMIAFLVVTCACLLTTTYGAEPAAKAKANASRGYPPDIEGADVAIYKTIDGYDLKMYIFDPDGHTPQDRRPAIVFFFGGGWRNGSPAQFVEQCRYFASRGMVAMTADYRVASRQGTKAIACVADGKSAIRWMRTHADDLGIDPERIVASGGSAGGHVAATTAVVPGMEEAGESTSVSSKPNTLVLLNPALVLAPVEGKLSDEAISDNLEQRVGDDPVKISPYHHIAADQAPTIIFFGTDDRLLQGARMYAQASQKAGNRCELRTWRGLKHGFFNYGRYDNRPFVETMAAADEFLVSLGYLQPVSSGE